MPPAATAPGQPALRTGSGVRHTARPAADAGQPGSGAPPAWDMLDVARRLRARERCELADFLHDGPAQELTAAALELGMLRPRGSEQAGSFDAVQQRLDAAAGAVRRLLDELWPFPRYEASLAAALERRTAWLLATPLTVVGGEQAGGLAADEIPAVVDVIELMLLDAVPAAPAARAQVSVRTAEQMIWLS